MKFKAIFIVLTLLCFSAKSQVLYEINGTKVIKEENILWLYSNSGKFELDTEVITIKENDLLKLQKTLTKYGLSILRISKSGYADISNTNKKLDIIDVVDLLKQELPSSSIEFSRRTIYLHCTYTNWT